MNDDMTLVLDDEIIQCLKDYIYLMGDESYAHHLAAKFRELYESQHGIAQIEWFKT